MFCILFEIINPLIKRNKNKYSWEKEIKKQNAEKLTEELLVPEDHELKNVLNRKLKSISLKKQRLNYLINTKSFSVDIASLKP